MIQVRNPGASGITEHYRKYHVRKYGKGFVEGNSATFIPVGFLNAFVELNGDKIAADVFIAMTEFAKRNKDRLKFSTLWSSPLCIYNFGHQVELRKVKTHHVDQFDYLFSQKAAVF